MIALGPRSRNHPGYWAFLLHRLSGVALALFLPLHFYVLGLAIEGEAALDGFLAWSERPPVRLAEWLLVVLLAAHMTGGLRLLALEFLPWREGQRALIALAAGIALAVGFAFLAVAG
jgi:fumarate reductase subunit D